MDFIFVSSSY